MSTLILNFFVYLFWNNLYNLKAKQFLLGLDFFQIRPIFDGMVRLLDNHWQFFALFFEARPSKFSSLHLYIYNQISFGTNPVLLKLS